MHFTPDNYPYKTTPFAHQLQALKTGWDRHAFAYTMEMRTGKTKTTIDNAGLLHMNGLIDGVLIVAPAGVHYDAWLKIHDDPKDHKGFFKHCAVPYKGVAWNPKAGKRYLQNLEETLYGGSPCLRVFSINHEAFLVKKAQQVIKKFLTTYRCLMAVDESSRIKTPEIPTTSTIIAAGKYAPYRRILTGTLNPNGHFDVYSQFEFLDWKFLGFRTFTEFKSYYGIWKLKPKGHFNPKTREYVVSHKFWDFVRYRNEDDLRAKIAKHSFTVLKRDCFDLPPKIYETVEVEMTPQQKQIYEGLRKEIVKEVGNGTIVGLNPLTRQMRLQQICGGFMAITRASKMDLLNGVDADTELEPIPGKNPKMERLKELLENTASKVIIWARFRPEIEMIAQTLKEIYGEDSTVIYYGGMSNEQKQTSLEQFKNGNARFFIGNASTGGYGLELNEAEYMIYYSNSYRLDDKMQSEERAHGPGQTKNLVVIELVIKNTADELPILAFKEKINLVDYLRIKGETYLHG